MNENDWKALFTISGIIGLFLLAIFLSVITPIILLINSYDQKEEIRKLRADLDRYVYSQEQKENQKNEQEQVSTINIPINPKYLEQIKASQNYSNLIKVSIDGKELDP